MKAFFEKYGQKAGHDLCEISLINDQQMTVKVLNYGATLEKVLLNGENMILSLKHPQDYSKERNFLGGTVGRICGRIAKGQWQHGLKTWQLPQNDGPNHIHGGNGTDQQVWNFTCYADRQVARVELTYFDPAMHNNFPGNLKLKAVYELNNQNELSYRLEAVSDELTIFNPANHTYFTLGEEAKDLDLQINADYYLPVAEDGLPTAEGMQQVTGTAFDFRKPKKINEALKSEDSQIKLRNGIDHPFILNGQQPAAVLTGQKHQMIMTTNAPAVVVYTANHFNHQGIAKNIGQYNGVTLEAQCPPSRNTDLKQITLLANEKFIRKVCWQFK